MAVAVDNVLALVPARQIHSSGRLSEGMPSAVGLIRVTFCPRHLLAPIAANFSPAAKSDSSSQVLTSMLDDGLILRFCSEEFQSRTLEYEAAEQGGSCEKSIR